jgi:uroporphyrinogen decarboxylase
MSPTLTTTDETSNITHRQRIEAAFRGEVLDRTPISLWRHFPGDDATAAGLAAATVRFQHQFDCDLVKLMPTGMYAVMDYGVTVKPATGDVGTTRFASGSIQQPEDWSTLPEVSPDCGILGQQVETVRLVRQELGPDTPIVQTIFSPLNVALKLVGSADIVLQMAADYESLFGDALAKITDDVIAFGHACCASGADGFFFATQLADRAAFPEEVYRNFGMPFDQRVLEALRPETWCTILHLHGDDPLFDLANAYPVDGVNWHDRESTISLSDALNRTSRILVAGIARRGAITQGTPQEVAAEVQDAIRQTDGRRLVVAPGCVIPDAAPIENLKIARRTVEGE